MPALKLYYTYVMDPFDVNVNVNSFVKHSWHVLYAYTTMEATAFYKKCAISDSIYRSFKIHFHFVFPLLHYCHWLRFYRFQFHQIIFKLMFVQSLLSIVFNVINLMLSLMIEFTSMYLRLFGFCFFAFSSFSNEPRQHMNKAYPPSLTLGDIQKNKKKYVQVINDDVNADSCAVKWVFLFWILYFLIRYSDWQCKCNGLPSILLSCDYV